MQVWIFGNPDLEQDALPIKMSEELKFRLPKLTFVFKDPNDSWENLPEKLVIIDTIAGIKEVSIFTSLDDFLNVPRVSMHDFDLGTKLKWLAKIKKLPPFTIIGVPMGATEEGVIDKIVVLLRELSITN